MGWRETHARAFQQPQLEALRNRSQALKEDLQKLQLGLSRAKHFGGGWHDANLRDLGMIAVVHS